MKDKLNDNDIDRIFRDSIESAEAEPSENFWNKAYEGIISRENSIYQKRMATWRNAAIALGLIVMGLVGYNVYMTGKVDNLGKQISSIEKFQSSNNSIITQNQTANNSIAANTNTHNKNDETHNQQIAQNNHPVAASVVNHSVAMNASVAHRTFSRNQIEHSENHNNNVIASVSNSNINTTSNEHTNIQPVVVAAENKSNTESVSNEQVAQQHNALVMLDNNQSKPANKIAETGAETKTKSAGSSDVIYPDVNASSSGLDTINDKALLSSSSKSKGWFMEKVMPNVSVSVFGAPVIASTVMNGYSVVDNLSAVQLQSREHQQLGYAYGANIGYNVSSKVTIEAGINYRSNQFTIDPATLYPHSGDVAQAYHFVTSSGTITMPYLPNAKPGDSVTAKGNAVRSYVSIPVQVKYNLINVRHKLTIYATGGAALNILSTNKATVDYKNTGGEDVVSVNSINGINKTTYSYLFGVGAEYKMGKGFALYAEPNYLGGITPINNAAYIRAYSNYFNMTVGLNYHF